MASRSSSPSFSSAASVVGVQLRAPISQTAPAAYLRALPSYGVVLCTEHRTCYTVKNVRRHLSEKHAVKTKLWKDIETWLRTQDIVNAVSNPPDHSPFIAGLTHENGYVCNTGDCTYRTTSEEIIQRHVSKEHGIDSRRKQRERHIYSKVLLQFFFAKAPDYFIVEPSAATLASPTQSNPPLPSVPLSSSSQAALVDHDQSISSILSLRIREAAEEQKARYRQIGEPNHVSEITPWLRKSGFHKHLANIDGEVMQYHHPRSISEITEHKVMGKLY